MSGKKLKFHMLLLAGCILFAGCAGRPGERAVSGAAGKGENVSIPSETDGESQEQDGTGQDIPAPGAADRPDGTAQMPEGDGEASGTDGEGSAQEDKNSRPEVGEKKLHLDMGSKINHIGEDKLLVYGNKEILILDMYTLEVIKRAGNETYEDKFIVEKVYQREDGSYMICGRIREELSSGWKTSQAVIDYDSELQAGRVLDLKETLCPDYEGSIRGYEFLDDGRKLLYLLKQNNICLYDFQSGEITEIVPRADMMMVGSSLYLENVNQVLFVGIYGNNQHSLIKMDMDGNILETNTEHSYGKMWDFGDFVLINEAVPAGEKGEGAFFVYDVKDGSVRSFPLARKETSGVSAITSGRGKYFVAYYPLPDKEIPYKLHIYSSEDGSLICEMQLSSEEFGEGVILNGIYIDDETERMILYGHWAGRSYETWIVSKDLFE